MTSFGLFRDEVVLFFWAAHYYLMDRYFLDKRIEISHISYRIEDTL